ncbi:DinB family protein [Hymenobacter sp. 15J16-1T3B]|uniref:DinB family protein n=1 Tax=Hymenobacter sp. 15J16-1T3B TaxID=2886941 RepID=UPI001D117DBC|nr:DinB family protein [Hymenobacter sp. 15J16-1T3B]MCC3159274.1 DinB family protein [Hymenobacter sp. 15J16-1T3B]
MSDPLTPPTLQTAFANELQQELHLTRRLLERVPTDRFDWRPHPKSMPIGKLAWHMANLTSFLDLSLQGTETDMTTVQWPAAATSTDDVLSRFNVTAASVQQTVAAIEDEQLHGPWTMRVGERVIRTMPRRIVLRTLVLNHLIHHRGQLSVYLRLLDIPVPSIYGPSADEQ